MLSALGHCEDLECKQSQSSIDSFVRLFRCTIHCDRLLCLHHLNAHNQYYEEEKKQNQFVLNELQNHLTIYQNLFDQHLQEYRELVQQASNLLLQNTSTTIPIEQIRAVLERIQRAMDVFRPEKIVVKNETTIDGSGFDIEKIDSTRSIDNYLIKKEKESPKGANRVVVRLERVECQLPDTGSPSKPKKQSVNHTQEKKRGRRKRSSSNKKSDKTKKKTDITAALKRRQK